MGAGCCKFDEEFNPDNTPKDPQTKEQRKEDGKELRRAALAADWAQMRVLLRRMPLRQICSGAEKDEVASDDEKGSTALHYAVSINHLRGIKKLLRYGSPPGLVNKAGKTPLHLALENGRLKAARILLEKSITSSGTGSTGQRVVINYKDAQGVTPLLAVVAAGRLKMAREVLAMCKGLDVGIDYDVMDCEGNSLVLFAAKWGWFEELEAWINCVQEPKKLLNVQNKEGETVLGHVLMFRASGLLNGQRAADLVKKLTELGALVKLPSFKEKVPLINLVAAADDKDIYNVLISAGADPLASRDALGRSPLHFAAAKGARLLAVELLNAGIKAYARDNDGNTPLHLAAMRGQEALVALLLERSDDKTKALLMPNKSGLTPYHLALKSGPDKKAQLNALSLIEQLGENFMKPVTGPKNTVSDTPLLLAIQGHQDKVVRALLAKGVSPNERNAAGEVPLARVLRCATAVTYDKDSDIFDQLMTAGADMTAGSSTAHPLLALCKNNLSRFTEKVVNVLKEHSGGQLDWDKRDEKGYTPLSLAAFYDNAWLVRYLIDEVGIDPNAESQRSLSTAPEVVGTTGGICSAKPITMPGTVPGQTPLMCAAKGGSLAAVQLLLNRKADVHVVDSLGRTALQHAMNLDKMASLQVAAALLRMGARPERGVKTDGEKWQQCTDLVGEHWPHRAVRYGMSSFLKLWAEYGGALDSLLSTTADDADDMPGAELKVEEKTDFLDRIPKRVNNLVEAEDEELVDDYNGEDSEKAQPGEDNEGYGSGGTGGQQPVAESIEPRLRQSLGSFTTSSNDNGSGDDCIEDEERDELDQLVASGQVETFYAGPTPRMILQWRRQGIKWWDDFAVDKDSLPDMELEDDPNWEDQYNVCDEGDDWIDEEDVEEEIWERIRAEQRSAANAVQSTRGVKPAGQQQLEQSSGGAGSGGVTKPFLDESLLTNVSSGLAHKLFRHRLPNAVVPEPVPRSANNGRELAAGSPSKWLRRKSSSSGSFSGVKGSVAAFASSSPAMILASPSSLSTNDGCRPLSKLEARRQSGMGSQPVAEAREQDSMQLVDMNEPEFSSEVPKPSARQMSQGRRGLHLQSSTTDEERAVLLLSPGDGSATLRSNSKTRSTSTSSMRGTSSALPAAADDEGAEAEESYGDEGGRLMTNALDQAKGLMGSCISGNRMHSNDPYYQSATMYDGLPRYMKMATEAHPAAKYDKYVSELEARVKSQIIKDDKMLEGPELRVRNITWYHKSMSPAEYPMKQGKWKSVQRMSAKAIDQARLRKPRKPAEKPQIRPKKVWFGLPPMPSRPELALTSPLVYAVRLCRVKCVETLVKYGGGELLDIPDVHGVTPLSYALYMLSKERHNKSLQQMVDLLLVSRPRVDSLDLWMNHLRPRMEEQLARMEKEAAEKGGESTLSKADRQAMKDLRTSISFFNNQDSPSPPAGGKVAPPNYPKLFPSVMEPLILAVMLNDVARITYLVQQLGANTNNSWVWLPDIPTYFNGLWEKQLGRCNSCCLPIHVAICQKQYETVRAMLDLGADPNRNGEEYSGDSLRDRTRKDEIAREKQKEMMERREAGAKFNPYIQLWTDASMNLKAVLIGAKNFISRIEIPGRTRPHPWLSPLHLAGRFGLADIAFLLIKRGAAINGGAASAFAPKSPLEEALMYARANAQAYGTTSLRMNYTYILEEACLEESDRMRLHLDEAKQMHQALHNAFRTQITDRATNLVNEGVKGAGGKAMSQVDMMAKVAACTMGNLGKYDPESLRYVPIPDMNEAVLSSKATKIYSDVMAMMDPVKGAIKAVALAAKIIIRILLDMLKRPIAHHDPALACAHVMLYFRVPIDIREKQTGILMRDILDNGNGPNNENLRRSYYRWLGIDPAIVREMAWLQTVVNKINVLKSNVVFGYVVMDLAPSYKEYDKAKRKFKSQVEGAILNIGTSGLMPHYLSRTIQEVVTAAGSTVADGGLEATLDALFDLYIQTTAERGKPPRGTAAVTDADLDQVARDLLPAWVYTAPPASNPEGLDIPNVLTEASGRVEVKKFIINRFMRYRAVGAQPQAFQPPPYDGDILTSALMAQIPQITMPSISPEALEEVQPTLDDLPDTDICKAVVRAYNAALVKRVEAQSKALQQLYTARVASANSKRDLLRGSKKVAAAVEEQLAHVQVLEGRLGFDEGPIFEAAIERPTWEAAIAHLGGSPGVRTMMNRLCTAQTSGELPRIADPLELVKGLGDDPSVLSVDALLDGLAQGVGAPFPPKLRAELAKIMNDAGSTTEAVDDGPEALVDKVAELAEEVQAGGVERANASLVGPNVDPRIAPMVTAVGRLVQNGELPSLNSATTHGFEALVATSDQISAVLKEKVAEGMETLQEGQRAMEAALSSGDFTGLVAMKGRISTLAAAGLAAALMPLLDKLKAQLAARNVDEAAAVGPTLDDLVERFNDTVTRAAVKLDELADKVASFANGEGVEDLADLFGVNPTELLQLLDGTAAGDLQRGAAAVVQALQEGDVAALTEGLEPSVAAGGKRASGKASRLGLLNHPRAKTLLGQFLESKLLPPEAQDAVATLEGEISESSAHFLDGLELDLSGDMMGLMNMLDQAREVLLNILEVLEVDEAF